MARIVLNISANADAARRAVTGFSAAVDAMRGRIRGLTLDAGKVALGMLGAQSATAALRTGMRQLSQSVRDYIATDERAGAQAAATSAAWRDMRAAIGEAIVGGDNATSVFGTLQGVADRLREAISRNQDTIQAFVREALARAVEAFARVVEVGGALIQTWTLVRGSAQLLAGAIRGALIAALAQGAQAIAALRDVGASLAEGLGRLVEGLGTLAAAVGQRGLATQLQRGAEGLRAYGAAQRDATEDMRQFARDGMLAAAQSIEEGRQAFASAADMMSERQAEIDRITGGMRELAAGIREGTVSARELRDELARPVRAAVADTGLDRLADRLRSDAEAARRALLGVSERLAEDRARLAEEYGAGAVRTEADAQREIVRIAARGTEGLTEEEIRRAQARLNILRSFLASAADAEAEAAQLAMSGERIRGGAEELRRSLLSQQERYAEDSLALARAYGVARVGVEFDTGAAIRELLAVDYASLSAQEQEQYAARLESLRAFEASRSAILEEEEARRLAVEAAAARQREEIQRRLQSATQQTIMASLSGLRSGAAAAARIVGDELLARGIAAVFDGAIRNAAFPGSGVALVGAGIGAQIAARKLGARGGGGVSAGTQAPASGVPQRPQTQVNQTVSLSALVLDDAALQALGVAMRQVGARGYA